MVVLFFVLLFVTASGSGRAEVRFEAPSSAWILTSGSVELQLGREAESVYLRYLGTTNRPAWQPVTSSLSAFVPVRGDDSGSDQGFVFNPALLKLISSQIRSISSGVGELSLSFEHRKRPLAVKVTYTAWADTGVLTCQVQVTNLSREALQVEECPSLVWELPPGDYEMSYLWSATGRQRQLRTEGLSVGGRALFGPQVAPWFSLQELRSGGRLLAQLESSDDTELRLEGAGGSSGMSSGLLVRMGHRLETSPSSRDFNRFRLKRTSTTCRSHQSLVIKGLGWGLSMSPRIVSAAFCWPIDWGMGRPNTALFYGASPRMGLIRLSRMATLPA